MAYFVKKRLQVFVSSTFLDLKDERQAAVKAILEAGHIPAGMELFTSGDESQLEVIKQWIEASDVYLLILGGRYGSLDDKSKKSYTHIEYEYAKELKKPSFACVMKEEYLDEKIRKDSKIANKDIYEQNNQEKFKEFKKLVMSKIVFQCSSFVEIENAVLKKMNEFERNADLIGWIKASESSDSKLLSNEVVRLSKENHELRERINTINSKVKNPSSLMLHGHDFQDILSILNQTLFSKEDLVEITEQNEKIDGGNNFFTALISEINEGNVCNLEDFIVLFDTTFNHNVVFPSHGRNSNIIDFPKNKIKILFDINILKINNHVSSEYGLPETKSDRIRNKSIEFTDDGKLFIKYLNIQMLKKNIQA
jgi:hypothetical protein